MKETKKILELEKFRERILKITLGLGKGSIENCKTGKKILKNFLNLKKNYREAKGNDKESRKSTRPGKSQAGKYTLAFRICL